MARHPPGVASVTQPVEAPLVVEERAAGARVVDRIAVPTLILHAQDDPFIRLLPDTRTKILANPHIRFVETRHGGHCAYLCHDRGNEIHWAEATVIRFLQAEAGQQHGS